MKWHDIRSTCELTIHLHEGVPVNGDKALRPIGAHLAPPAPVCRNYRLEHLRPLLEGYEEGRMPTDQQMPQMCVPLLHDITAALPVGLSTSISP